MWGDARPAPPVIDLHCHLLPGVDDGPRTLEEALALARAFVAAGAETVVATPHVSPSYPNTADRIEEAHAALSGVLAAERIPLHVLPGAELDLLHARQLPARELARLCLGDSRALLVECPFVAVVPGFEAMVGELRAQGHVVVLAHPERSPLFLRDAALLPRLVAAGTLASVTAAALVGGFGRDPRRFALRAIADGLVHDVASDAHDVARRPPLLRDALRDAGLAWTADWLLRDAPTAILAGASPPPRPAAPSPSPWRRLRTALHPR